MQDLPHVSVSLLKIGRKEGEAQGRRALRDRGPGSPYPKMEPEGFSGAGQNAMPKAATKQIENKF